MNIWECHMAGHNLFTQCPLQTSTHFLAGAQSYFRRFQHFLSNPISEVAVRPMSFGVWTKELSKFHIILRVAAPAVKIN